jgi:uncharacterized membrane protein YccC
LLSRVWPPPAVAQLAIRTTAGALITYAVAVGLGLPQAVWAVITALVVMQVSVGATIGAGIDRMTGTLGGAVVGALVAAVQPRLGLPDYLALALAVAPLAAVAAVRPRLRIAPLTAAIILLAAPPDVPASVAALERIFEIALGTAVGLAASLLIFPARAHTFLRRHAADGLRQLGWLVEAHLAAAAATADEAAILERQARMRRAIAAAEASAAEVGRERASHVSDVDDPLPILRSLRRVRSDIALLSRTTPLPLPEPLAGRLAPTLRNLASALRGALDELARSLASRMPAPDLAAVDAAIAAFEGAWAVAEPEIDQALRTEAGPKAAMALPFAIETLRRDLGDFAAVAAVLAERGRRHVDGP